MGTSGFGGRRGDSTGALPVTATPPPPPSSAHTYTLQRASRQPRCIQRRAEDHPGMPKGAAATESCLWEGSRMHTPGTEGGAWVKEPLGNSWSPAPQTQAQRPLLPRRATRHASTPSVLPRWGQCWFGVLAHKLEIGVCGTPLSGCSFIQNYKKVCFRKYKTEQQQQKRKKKIGRSKWSLLLNLIRLLLITSFYL